MRNMAATLSTSAQKKRASGSLRRPRFSFAKRSGVFELVRVHCRARILALGFGVAVNQFDDRHRRAVAGADTGLDHARIAALAVGITLGQNVEQLLELRFVAQTAPRQAAVGKTAARKSVV